MDNNVPYIVYEGEAARHERTVKRLIILWIVGTKNAHRDREILKDRLIEGMCFEPLAEKHDMSVAQVKRIVYKSQEKLFRHLK